MSMKIRGADGRLYTVGAALVTGLTATVVSANAEPAAPVEQVQEAAPEAATDLLAGAYEFIPVG